MNNKYRILVADDEAILSESVAKIFEDRGYEVETAKNGEEALDKLRIADEPFDLLITDFKMPRMNGLRLLRTAVKEFTDLEAIMITGFADIDSTVKAMREGAFDYLPKPFAPRTLIKTVERCLGYRSLKIRNRKLQEEAETARKEAEMNHVKSQFFHIMSHEFRTPLSHIIGFADLLTTRKNPPETAATIEGIKRSGWELLTLMENLLDLATIKMDGKLNLFRTNVRLDRLALEVMEEIKQEAKANGLTLRVELDKGVWLQVDEARLRQILTCLLKNALKFTSRGGITLRLKKEKGQVLFEVQDTGRGIEEADMPYLFNVFRQGDMSDTRRYGGAGIGLALAKELVEMHSGKISTQSKLGEGATFTFSIPLTI